MAKASSSQPREGGISRAQWERDIDDIVSRFEHADGLAKAALALSKNDLTAALRREVEIVKSRRATVPADLIEMLLKDKQRIFELELARLVAKHDAEKSQRDKERLTKVFGFYKPGFYPGTSQPRPGADELAMEPSQLRQESPAANGKPTPRQVPRDYQHEKLQTNGPRAIAYVPAPETQTTANSVSKSWLAQSAEDGFGIPSSKRKAEQFLDSPANPQKRQKVADQQPSSGERTVSFDEIFQDGKAKHKHYIVDYEKNWYILKCEEHGVHFRRHAVHGAAKHLNGQSHGNMPKEHSLAITHLGYVVSGCNAELAKKNNDVADIAFQAGYVPLNLLHNQRSGTRVAKLAGKKLKTPKITNPVAGELYYTLWPKRKEKYAVMVLGWTDLSMCGYSVKFSQLPLYAQTKARPPCYLYGPDGITGWANGYEDGGPLVAKRQFPVHWFTETRKTQLGWVEAKSLFPFILRDPKRPLDPNHTYNVARDWYARSHGYQTFDMMLKQGRKALPTGVVDAQSTARTGLPETAGKATVSNPLGHVRHAQEKINDLPAYSSSPLSDSDSKSASDSDSDKPPFPELVTGQKRQTLTAINAALDERILEPLLIVDDDSNDEDYIDEDDVMHDAPETPQSRPSVSTQELRSSTRLGADSAAFTTQNSPAHPTPSRRGTRRSSNGFLGGPPGDNLMENATTLPRPVSRDSSVRRTRRSSSRPSSGHGGRSKLEAEKGQNIWQFDPNSTSPTSKTVPPNPISLQTQGHAGHNRSSGTPNGADRLEWNQKDTAGTPSSGLRAPNVALGTPLGKEGPLDTSALPRPPPSKEDGLAPTQDREGLHTLTAPATNGNHAPSVTGHQLGLAYPEHAGQQASTVASRQLPLASGAINASTAGSADGSDTGNIQRPIIGPDIVGPQRAWAQLQNQDRALDEIRNNSPWEVLRTKPPNASHAVTEPPAKDTSKTGHLPTRSDSPRVALPQSAQRSEGFSAVNKQLNGSISSSDSAPASNLHQTASGSRTSVASESVPKPTFAQQTIVAGGDGQRSRFKAGDAKSTPVTAEVTSSIGSLANALAPHLVTPGSPPTLARDTLEPAAQHPQRPPVLLHHPHKHVTDTPHNIQPEGSAASPPIVAQPTPDQLDSITARSTGSISPTQGAVRKEGLDFNLSQSVPGFQDPKSAANSHSGLGLLHQPTEKAPTPPQPSYSLAEQAREALRRTNSPDVTNVSISSSTPRVSVVSLGNGMSSGASTPKVITSDPMDRWRAVRTSGSPRVSPGVVHRNNDAATVSVSPSVTPRHTTPSFASGVKADPDASRFFDLASFSDGTKQWNHENTGPWLRLLVDDSRGIAETSASEAFRAAVVPSQVKTIKKTDESVTLTLLSDKGSETLHIGFKSNDASGRHVSGRIQARKFQKWVEGRNPAVQHVS